jgi:ubiquinone biosynthesis protein
MQITDIPQLARNLNRFREIVGVLSKYGLADGIARLNLTFARDWLHSPAGEKLATLTTEARIRMVLQELGPTFIKLGQLLSTRGDLVGPALANELTKLQDQANVDSFEQVRAIIEQELGRTLESIFAHFEPTPIASASIAQVHRARMPDNREVVVKVQHPGIVEVVRKDLELIKALAELAEQFVPEVRRYQPRQTIQHMQRSLMRELDFHQELRHLEQFARNFADEPTVRFPTPYIELCTKHVLCMEYLDGVSVRDIDGLLRLGVDRAELARRGARLFMDMIFRDGFFHADPHPGNLLILPNPDPKGQPIIGLIDVGMVGRLDERIREAVEDLLLGLADQDPEQITMLLSTIGALQPEVDTTLLNAEIGEFLATYAGLPLDQLELATALEELLRIIRAHAVVLPPDMAVLLKVLVMLEGTGKLLHPTFSLSEILQSYQTNLMLRRYSPAMLYRKMRRFYRTAGWIGELLPRGIIMFLRRMQRGRPEIQINHTGLEEPVNRLVGGLLIAALAIASALLWGLKAPPVFSLAGSEGLSLPGTVGMATAVVLGFQLYRRSSHVPNSQSNLPAPAVRS